MYADSSPKRYRYLEGPPTKKCAGKTIGCQILGKSIVGKYRGGVKMIMVPSPKKYIEYVPYGKIILNSDMHVMQLYGPGLLGR